MTELEAETISDAPVPRDGDSFAATVAGTAALTGAVIGNLKLTERIGVGGMGVVYKALRRDSVADERPTESTGAAPAPSPPKTED
jgi:hypothetical protein